MKREISISELKVGYVLEQDIKTNDGKVLIKKGSILTERLIERLKQWNAKADCKIFVDDCQENAIDTSELENRVLASLENVYEANSEELSGALTNLESNISHIYDDLKTIEDLPDDVIRIRYANVSGGHYFRMAKMAAALASLYNNGVPEAQKISLSSITLSALLHDYGMKFKNDLRALSKLSIDKSDYETNVMLNVPYKDEHNSVYSHVRLRDSINGPYNEKYHTAYAFVALKDKVSEEVRATILYSNHTKEAFQNRKFNTIVKAAKIISICDVYDTLLEYAIKEDMSEPFENVISYMAQLAHNNLLDYELYKLFLRHIPIYPVGSKVLLSNGEYAVVVKRSLEFPTKPLVLTLNSASNLIDLSEKTNITIRRIVRTEDKARDKVDAIQKEQLSESVGFVEDDVIPEGSTPGTLELRNVGSNQAKTLGKRFPFSTNRRTN